MTAKTHRAPGSYGMAWINKKTYCGKDITLPGVYDICFDTDVGTSLEIPSSCDLCNLLYLQALAEKE